MRLPHYKQPVLASTFPVSVAITTKAADLYYHLSHFHTPNGGACSTDGSMLMARCEA